MVVHSGGVVFTSGSIGETDSLALVKASGATGARLGYGQSRINSSGYGIMPYMSAYRENRVSLDISTLEADVEIKNTSAVAVPRNGSVVFVNFETDEGRSLVLELQRSDNGFIPLGADVLNEKNESIGTVGRRTSLCTRCGKQRRSPGGMGKRWFQLLHGALSDS